ncbi:MAG: Clp protease N-terminal domain-containing protein [Capsulimonas sp.]|uniref:Clp protease N-terminal domain-containing protein n=1 Tax=Capsulimonas sp. TaxID=2494211 RepID=UPI0032653084
MSEWDILSKSSRVVMFKAQEVAALCGQCEVTPDHLLQALLENPDAGATELLEGIGARCKSLIHTLKQRQPRGNGALGAMELAPFSKQSLNRAFRLRQEHGAAEVEGAHLLAGILESAETRGDESYQQIGLDAARIKQALGLGASDTDSPKVWPPAPTTEGLPTQADYPKPDYKDSVIAIGLALISISVSLSHFAVIYLHISWPFVRLALIALNVAAVLYGIRASKSPYSGLALVAIIIAITHTLILSWS